MEAWRDGPCWASAAGLGLDPALQHFVSPRSPSPSPAPGPTAPFSRAGTGKWMSLFMKPIMLPAKQGTQQSSAAPLMGYYLCHFPPGAGAITVLDSVPSPSTPPAMFQCHAEGCVLPSSWLDLASWVGALAGAGWAASHSANQRSLGPLLPVGSSLSQSLLGQAILPGVKNLSWLPIAPKIKSPLSSQSIRPLWAWVHAPYPTSSTCE